VIGALRTGDAGTLRCSASIPHNATVTSVSFHVRDAVATELGPCKLSRASSTGAVVDMADAGSTSGMPGNTTLTDTTITNPVVDKSAFTYWAQCDLSANSADLGIYGVNVTYLITAANG
jgi:hypothetical protein